MSARRALGSGWIPAVLIAVVAGWLVHGTADVSIGDVLRFFGYLAGWIVLPGTLVWRLVDRGPQIRSLGEDLAIGALVGYVLEFPVYMTCLAAGAPRAYLGWPVLAIVVTTVIARLARRRGLWTLATPSELRLKPGTSWGIAVVLGYVVLWFTHHIWSPTPSTAVGITRPYVDEPYHLSLAASLKHFFPAKVLFLDDTPLKYHYLSHLHFAASSWVSGVEPIVLIRSLGTPFLFLLVMLATARVTMRLTGAAWSGPAVVAGLLVVPENLTGWHFLGSGVLDGHLVFSPSAGFVNAALLLGLLLCIEILRGTQTGWPAWCLVALTFVAMLGAKSASLPTLLVGLWVAAIVVSVLRRRPDRVALGLSVVATVAFVVGKQFFFGSSMQGLTFDLFATTRSIEHRYPSLIDATGAGKFGVHISLAIGDLVGYLTLGAGALALLIRRGWREADAIFLVFTCLAGLGAGFSFNQQGGSEFYFIYVVMLPLLLAAALGWHRMRPALGRRHLAVLVVTSLAAGLATAGILTASVDRLPAGRLSGSIFSQLMRVSLLPNVGLTVLVLAVSAVLCMAWRLVVPGIASPLGLRALVVPILVLTAAGAGTYVPLRGLGAALEQPIQPAMYPAGVAPIGVDGIQSARWLRDHSGVDDLVATNAHCALPTEVRLKACSTQNFWMAGYAERQFLVEGWAYVTRASVGLVSPPDENIVTDTFWDPRRLAINDALFQHPSVATLGALERAYRVKWLFVDLRYPVDYPGLLALRGAADLVHLQGAYAVFAVR